MTATITPRERQVYEAIAANRDHRRLSRRVIAQQLGMTEECLAVLLSKARAKLGADATRGRPDIDNDQQETPREARARVARDLAAGKRCSQCWLLLPCDHMERSAA